jgi:hypothetical protein
MSQRTLPIAALLINNSRRWEPMDFCADLLRNIPNLTRVGGAKVPIVAPTQGRPMESAMIEFIVFLSGHYLSTAVERSQVKFGEIPKRRPGQRFDLDVWLRSSAIILKLKQAEISCGSRNKTALVNKYLARPEAGRFQDKQGVSLEHLKEWRRKKDSLQSDIWTTSFVKLILSCFVPRGFEDLAFNDQRAHLNSLKILADECFSLSLDKAFPVEFFSFFLDFSQHSEDEIKALISGLEATVSLSKEERYARLAIVLQPAIESILDLIGDVDEVFSKCKISVPGV